MKTIVITFLFGALISISTLCAAEPQKKVLTNNEKTEWGYIEENTYFHSDGITPENKEIYLYNTNGNALKKTIYQWNKFDGWIGLQQDNFEYNKKGEIVKVTRSNWNKKQKDWSKNKKEYIYIYDTDGTLTAIK